jgi:broad specificity phosphatase PhoE
MRSNPDRSRVPDRHGRSEASRAGGGVLSATDFGWPAALWLVRHGESLGNVANADARDRQLPRLEIDVTDAEVSLSATGEKQARALGVWLAGLPPERRPTRVVVSPYTRAMETAELVLAEAGLEALPLSYDERLRDREQGVIDRLTRVGFRDRYPEEAERAQYVGKFWYRPMGGESWADVILRLRSALLDFRLSWPADRLLLVSHDMPILGFRYVLEGLTPAAAVALSGMVQNCSVTQYERESDQLVLRAFSDTSALDESASAPVTAHE